MNLVVYGLHVYKTAISVSMNLSRFLPSNRLPSKVALNRLPCPRHRHICVAYRPRHCRLSSSVAAAVRLRYLIAFTVVPSPTPTAKPSPSPSLFLRLRHRLAFAYCPASATFSIRRSSPSCLSPPPPPLSSIFSSFPLVSFQPLQDPSPLQTHTDSPPYNMTDHVVFLQYSTSICNRGGDTAHTVNLPILAHSSSCCW